MELVRLAALPSRHRLIVEDAWLGAALWRHVGLTREVSLFSLSPLWGTVYRDSAGFRVRRSLAIYHNRHKLSRRLSVLYNWSVRDHCSANVTWRLMRRDCCGGGRVHPSRGRTAVRHARIVGRRRPPGSTHALAQPKLWK